MKLLPNINKSVPEAADPALIKPVSDAIEALDTALGAKPSTLTTTAKTLVGAINEVDGDPDVLKLRPWTANTDADTLGTGIYQIIQSSNHETFNYPYGFGLLLSLNTGGYFLQIFSKSDASAYYIRSGRQSTGWRAWQNLTVV